MNARNPFATRRADFQQRLVNLTLSGPISEKKSSFFLDFQRREEDDNDIINATVLDSGFNPVRVNDVVFQPRRFTTFSPRFDYAINENHTLVLRYSFSRTTLENSGVGQFQLASRGFNTENTQHTFQMTETAVINPKLINETRFQYVRDSNEQNDTNPLSSVVVNDSFLGGGAQVGLSFVRASRWELQNYSTATWFPNHMFRFGVRLRGVRLTDVSRNNFGGTFVFSSLEQYQAVLRGDAGALPSQFTITGGEPEATVSQVDLGAFFQDEWRIRPNLTLTLGVRYETQSNISSRFNFAPRAFFAWAPGGSNTGTIGQFGAGQPKFVIRGGGGLFYDRFNESGTLGLNRFNGVDQLRFNLSSQDPEQRPIMESLLAGVVYNPDGTITNVPTIDALVGLNQPQVVNRIDPNLRAPYSMLGALNIERQLPYNFTVFGVLFTYRTRHALVFRDVNAPLPGTLERPDPNFGNVFRWESSGVFNDTRLMIGVRNQINPRLLGLRQLLDGQGAEQHGLRLREPVPVPPVEQLRPERGLRPRGLLPAPQLLLRRHHRRPETEHRAQPVHHREDGPVLQHHDGRGHQRRPPLPGAAGLRRRADDRGRPEGHAMGHLRHQPGAGPDHHPAQLR